MYVPSKAFEEFLGKSPQQGIVILYSINFRGLKILFFFFNFSPKKMFVVDWFWALTTQLCRGFDKFE